MQSIPPATTTSAAAPAAAATDDNMLMTSVSSIHPPMEVSFSNLEVLDGVVNHFEAQDDNSSYSSISSANSPSQSEQSASPARDEAALMRRSFRSRTVQAEDLTERDAVASPTWREARRMFFFMLIYYKFNAKCIRI